MKRNSRFHPFGLFAGLAVVLTVPAFLSSAAAQSSTAERPNVLWITTEDLSPVLGCYGDTYAVTPNLDRLAEQGVRYTHAFAMASVCTPARSCLITGVYSSSLGTQHLRGEQPLARDVRCYTEYLRQAGYYCTNNVKEDYNFVTPKTAWDESSNKAHWRNRRAGQPFFAIFNLMTTHQSRIRFSEADFAELTARVKPQQRHDPQLAPLPPYYPDTPVVRRDVARLYDLVTAMDLQTQDLLDQLEEDGLAEDTIVFFYADHGTGMPRHKRWLYDSGTRVPLIIRFPRKYQHLAPGNPGTTIDRLVSFVDFPPTMLSLLNVPIPDYMQGQAFLGQAAGPPREYLFAIRDRVDEVFEMSRSVRDRRFQYIRNYMPHRPRMQHSDFSEITPTRQELRRLAAAGQLAGAAADFMSPTKAPEELYDTQADPHEIRNLAGDSEYRETLQRLRQELHSWMVRTRDTGLVPEVEMIARSDGGSLYDVARREGRFDVERVLEAADWVGCSETTTDTLTTALKDHDAAVRFWAATALAAKGRDAAGARAALLDALEDPAPNVRFAAAEAICHLSGENTAAVNVLSRGLQDDSPVVRLYAAITLVAVGEAGRPAAEQMRKTMESEANAGTYPLYIRWALKYALENLSK